MNYQSKPDLLTLVILIVGTGVVLTTVAQADDRISSPDYPCIVDCEAAQAIELPDISGVAWVEAEQQPARSSHPFRFERYPHAQSLTDAKRSWGFVRRSESLDLALTLNRPGVEVSGEVGKFRTGVRLETAIAGQGDTALMLGLERRW